MATLDDPLKIDDVVAAGEFTADGKLADFRANMDMPSEMAEITAQFCATVTIMFNTLAGAFGQLSQMNWVPQQGWMYAGGDWTVAIGGNRGVLIETALNATVTQRLTRSKLDSSCLGAKRTKGERRQAGR